MTRSISNALTFCLVLGAMVFGGCARTRVSSPAQFQQLADEFLAGHLAWRPSAGVALGLHQYDGRITDFRLASIEAELRRLKDFEQEIAAIDEPKLAHGARFDRRLLLSSIRSEIFWFDDARFYRRNPIVGAR